MPDDGDDPAELDDSDVDSEEVEDVDELELKAVVDELEDVAELAGGSESPIPKPVETVEGAPQPKKNGAHSTRPAWRIA
ncbi:hypothetical protein OV203_01535 [Nannocystis sp. ILAH1]|uniref:hypothetical protein n=1 Tax=Nannocystis sp. ILAH1 TaxID=2996789 RepID=UPI00227003B1|nr:hypothetical protein [Nannocystis sp. ILAH1]MCY0985793.1 hypothetical protein [Nannocystis sp. ILAH1]